jgi:flavodoxin
MKGLVVYDSKYGNTGLIAEAIASTLKYKAMPVSEIPPERLLAYEHVILGTPTHMARPSDAMINLLIGLPGNVLTGVNFTCFSTCVDGRDLGLIDRGFSMLETHRHSEIKLPKHVLQSLPQEVQHRLAEVEEKLPLSRAMLPSPPSLILPSHAAQIMSILLHEAGAAPLGKAVNFYVQDIEGPLKEGEIDRATEWAKELRSSVKFS